MQSHTRTTRDTWSAALTLSALSLGAAGCSSTSPGASTAGSGGAGGVATSAFAGDNGGTAPIPVAGAPGGAGAGDIACAGGGGSSVLGVAGAAVSSAGGNQSGAAGGSAGSGGALVTDPGTDGDGTSGIAAPFKAAPEMSEQPGVTKGQLLSFTMANSTTFGDGARKVALYLPAGYVSGTELPFIVAQDGISPQNGGSFGLDDLRPLLDNMIAAGALPLMAAIFVDPGSQRSVEYDTVSDKYYQFVETELLPEAINQAQTKSGVALNLTKDPQGRCAFGGSSGGAAAFTMGWFHPESYARILTISGTFVGLQSTAQYPDGGAEYPEHLIPDTTPNKPLRVFISAGSNDLGGGRWRAANDATAKALAAKQYHYRYIQAQGATHEDDGARRQYLPEAMTWLWRGYPIAKP